MSEYYKKLFRNILVIMFFIFSGVSYIIYQTFEDYAVIENQRKVQDLLMHNRALHSYVEETLKPIIYDFQDKGILSLGYFNPEILSFTYISRHIMQKYNDEREKSNLEPYVYRVASDNPRNIINKASEEESELLKHFNETNLTHFTNRIIKNSKEYIYYAMPITKSQASCMRCHSTPELAPKGLLDMYGSKGGFGEVLGKSRALTSLTIPLEEDIQKMHSLFGYILASFLMIYIVTATIIYFLIKNLSFKDKRLRDKIKHDGLTHIYNRYKFDYDIEKLTNSQTTESLHLMMFDIDHFKNINDTYGHHQGDVILKELCTLIEKNTRPTDKFYRVGGEEFAIFSFTNTHQQELDFANRIRKIVQEHKFDTIENLTISLGFTQFIYGESLTSLYNRADKALYNAKENGRNRVEFL